MLDFNPWDKTTNLDEHAFDGSMIRQMPAVSNDPDIPPPDLYLFTADSAIPAADSIRGYYRAAGTPLPALNYVEANRDKSKFLGSPNIAEGIAIVTETASFAKELARLQPIIKQKQHVCVVEQYSLTGNTLRYAGLLLKYAGVETISGIRGTWYEQAREKDIKRAKLTSRHARFMRKIGERAYRASIESDVLIAE